jgi:hypothetical protein
VMEGPSSLKSKARSGGSGESGSMSPTLNRQRVKQDVCEEVYRRLAEYGDASVNTPGFIEELQAHFNRLPTR